MKTKRLLAVLTASALLATMLAGCGGDDASSNADNGGETAEAVKDVQVWATGSDNVRQVFEKLVEDFNTNSEYAGTYEANLNFILSGTGGGTLADQLVAAYRAGQTESEFDVSDLGDDDLTKILSLTDENVLQDLDMLRASRQSRSQQRARSSRTAAPPSSWLTTLTLFRKMKSRRPWTNSSSGSRRIRAALPTTPRVPAARATPSFVRRSITSSTIPLH